MPPMNISEAVEAYLDYKRFLRGCAPRSIHTYEGHLSRFRAYCPRLDTLDDAAARVEPYLIKLGRKGYAENTLRQVFALLDNLYTWAHEHEHARVNPLRDRRLPKVHDQRRVFLRREQAHELLGAIRRSSRVTAARDYALAAALYFAGLRISEALALRFEDVLLDTGRLRVMRKGGKVREADMSPALRRALAGWMRRHPTRTDYLFPGRDGPGRAMNEGTARGLLRDVYAPGAGLSERVTPHVMRRTAADVMHGRGVPIQAIQDFLDHKVIGTTQIYLRARAGRTAKWLGKL